MDVRRPCQIHYGRGDYVVDRHLLAKVAAKACLFQRHACSWCENMHAPFEQTQGGQANRNMAEVVAKCGSEIC